MDGSIANTIRAAMDKNIKDLEKSPTLEKAWKKHCADNRVETGSEFYLPPVHALFKAGFEARIEQKTVDTAVSILKQRRP